jgi:tagatose 6-phosphate kinase
MTSPTGGYDVLVAAPNPALDSYYVVPALAVGSVSRAHEVLHTAGGKGNNLARAAVQLGGRVLSVGILGGDTGERIRRELAREGIDSVAVPGLAETRQCITVVRQGGGENTVVLEHGAPVRASDISAFANLVLHHAPSARSVVFNGSLPPGMAPEACAGLIASVRQAHSGLALALDTSGDALRLGALAGPSIVKVNVEELMQAFAPTETWSAGLAARIALDLRTRGVGLLVVTDGQHGAYAFPSGAEPLKVQTPVTRWISTAGAGDSFLAGLLLALGRGETLREALAQASAAAVASLQHVICGQIDRADFQAFRTATRIESLPVQVTP